jgi:hypothetical protein
MLAQAITEEAFASLPGKDNPRELAQSNKPNS